MVYCMEEIDNGENLSSIMVNVNQNIEETYDNELLEGCSVLHITGKKISDKGWDEETLYQNRKMLNGHWYHIVIGEIARMEKCLCG